MIHRDDPCRVFPGFSVLVVWCPGLHYDFVFVSCDCVIAVLRIGNHLIVRLYDSYPYYRIRLEEYLQLFRHGIGAGLMIQRSVQDSGRDQRYWDHGVR